MIGRVLFGVVYPLFGAAIAVYGYRNGDANLMAAGAVCVGCGAGWHARGPGPLRLVEVKRVVLLDNVKGVKCGCTHDITRHGAHGCFAEECPCAAPQAAVFAWWDEDQSAREAP